MRRFQSGICSLHKDAETIASRAGRGGSAVVALLCPFSLLTGNFTGNFAKLRLGSARDRKYRRRYGAFDANSPRQIASYDPAFALLSNGAFLKGESCKPFYIVR